MFILHADNLSLDKEIINEILEDGTVVYKRFCLVDEIISFLAENKISLLVIGEKLDDGTGLELINSINNSTHHRVPIIYLVDNKDNYHLEHYATIGVKDCILRSNLSIYKLKSYLKLLDVQNKVTLGMSSLSVAIVDDSKLSLKVAESILKEEKITNITLFDDPITLLKDYKYFDLFLVDIVMPGISGDKLVSMIRKISPKSIIIAMSTVDNVKTISNVLGGGADDYVIKPLTNVELIARIKTNYRSFMLLKELEDKNMELDRLSKTDSLTGAYNHGHIFNTVKKEIIRAGGSGLPLSMLLIDLDLFKKVNDTYGHGVGDEVLISLSKLFIKACQGKSYFGRYGGEEFVFVMTDTDLEEASILSNRLNKEFQVMEISGINEPVTFSGGLVLWDGTEGDKEFMKRADGNLYRAKDTGRNRIIE